MGLCVTLFLEIKEKKGRPSRGRGGGGSSLLPQ